MKKLYIIWLILSSFTILFSPSWKESATLCQAYAVAVRKSTMQYFLFFYKKGFLKKILIFQYVLKSILQALLDAFPCWYKENNEIACVIP